MTANAQSRTLPIRRWLALALVGVFLIPVCATAAFAVASVRGEPHSPREAAVQQLRDGVSQWHDPAWQAATKAELDQSDVAFVLTEGGQELYRSSVDPFTAPDGGNRPRLVERVAIPGSEPEKVAYVYADETGGPPEAVPVEYLPFVGLTALTLTLGGIAWFVGRTIVRPLTATSDAARQVAAGDLEVELPSSRVREIAELNTAFETMSAELRTSLQHQAEMEQERRLFIGAVAHDLRTPLFALRGHLEGLQKGLADTPEKRDSYVAVAQDKATDLERLISDLFDFTRLEYLEQAPNQESLEFDALLRRLVDGVRPRAETKRVEVGVAGPPEPCVVAGDNHLLTRAVENLLDNAIRHTPDGGSIRVTCDAGPDTVTFTISDTGPGIPEHDLPNLFTPLYRGEASRNRRTGGAGLGLTIAQSILLAHGGDLTAGNLDGGGAVFTGSLPLSGQGRSEVSEEERFIPG